MSPRVKNAAATREAMLASAGRRFLQESYENVGLRDIAGDAGVDVALVSRYFGSKEGLFREVLRGSKGEWLDAGVTRETLPAWLTCLATRVHRQEDDRQDLERLLLILRSASSPKAARIVHDSFRENVLTPVANLIDGEDPEMRASLALSLLIGSTILRTIMEVDAFSTCDVAPVRERMLSLFKSALAQAPRGEAA
ncbi:MAG TPA: TetR family transcriptional regulator [Allosphingosinicella sp.]|jgi:AcrR family transcriptional regulator